MSDDNKKDENSSPPDDKEVDSPVDKKEKNEDSAKESEKESEKSESEEEEMGLLDRPVEITGSRERKKVQRLELTFATPKDKHDIPEGSGQKLGECPRIEFQIQKNAINKLKTLHKILFNRPGSGNEVRKNIRKFSGFTFAKGSAEFEKKKAVLEKLTLSVLKHVCEVLDIERGGSKEDITSRVSEFLLNPKASDKKVPTTKRKLAARSDKKKPQDKKSKAGKKTTKGKKDASNTEESDSEHASSSEADEEEGSMSDEAPKKKRKVSAPKQKETSQKGKKKAPEKAKKEEKKSTARGTKKDRDEDSEGSSDDEPLLNQNKMPSDEEIKKLVKEILDSADLQEITMKKVIKQVGDMFPEFDMSPKKDFIKSTVKSVIS